MPKFNVTAEFSLSTTVEPEFYRGSLVTEDAEGVEDIEDRSYFQSSEVESTGGEVTFIVTAEDEHEAESLARGVIDDGHEVEDSNGFTWLVDSLYFQIEAIEEPMTLERAQEILGNVAENAGEEVAEAVEFVFGHLASLTARVDALVQSVEAERATVTRLSESLAAHREASE